MSTSHVASARVLMKESPLEWAKICLRGVGQVMFQENALTGLLFLLGIAAAGWEETPALALWMAFGGLVGTVVGTLTAWVLKYDEKELRAGIYGFNSTLVGIATFFFFTPAVSSVLILIVGSAIGTVVTWLMRRYVPFPTYTFPFIVTTWVLVAVGVEFGMTRVVMPPPPDNLNIITALTEGLSEVMLQASVVTGIAFLIGLGLNDWRAAALGFFGSLVGTLVGLYHQDGFGAISIGIYGYNAALTAIALFLWRRSLLIPILGAIISTPITEAFTLIPAIIPGYKLPALTAPFVFACWIVIALGVLERYFCGQPKAE